ncbi:hypothetical protein LTR74_003724 [Friedmanniomyces endolithicus]|nr:hypothetical protein LTR74_003724 [Friedmanniomyces endolithicus]
MFCPLSARKRKIKQAPNEPGKAQHRQRVLVSRRQRRPPQDVRLRIPLVLHLAPVNRDAVAAQALQHLGIRRCLDGVPPAPTRDILSFRNAPGPQRRARKHEGAPSVARQEVPPPPLEVGRGADGVEDSRSTLDAVFPSDRCPEAGFLASARLLPPVVVHGRRDRAERDLAFVQFDLVCLAELAQQGLDSADPAEVSRSVPATWAASDDLTDQSAAL